MFDPSPLALLDAAVECLIWHPTTTTNWKKTLPAKYALFSSKKLIFKTSKRKRKTCIFIGKRVVLLSDKDLTSLEVVVEMFFSLRRLLLSLTAPVFQAAYKLKEEETLCSPLLLLYLS